MNFNDYVDSGSETPYYYCETDDGTLKEGLGNEQITQSEFERTDDKKIGKYYQLFKNGPDGLPPGRPTVRGCGSLTEDVSKFVDYHIKNLAVTHPSYLKDTPVFLDTWN